MLPRGFQCWKRFCPVMNRHRSFGMLDQRVVALPILVRLLMHLHFDLNVFVDRLNHKMLLYQIARTGTSIMRGIIAARAIFDPGDVPDNQIPAVYLLLRQHRPMYQRPRSHQQAISATRTLQAA